MNEFDNLMGLYAGVDPEYGVDEFGDISEFEEDLMLDGLGRRKKKKKKKAKKKKKFKKWLKNRKAFVRKSGKNVKKFAKSKVGKAIGRAAIGAAIGLAAGPVASAISNKIAKTKQAKAARKAVTQMKQAGIAPSSKEVKEIVKESKAVAANPGFKEAVKKMEAEGKTDKQITQNWVKSDSYAQTAIPQVAATIKPQIYKEQVAKGVPPKVAAAVAQEKSDQIAVQTVDQIQQEAEAGSKPFNPLLLAPLAIIPFLMG